MVALLCIGELIMKGFIAACVLATASASSLRGDFNASFGQPVSTRNRAPKGWYVLPRRLAFAN